MFKCFLTRAIAGLLLFSVTAYATSRQDPLRPPGHKITESAKNMDKAYKKEVQAWVVNEILHSEGRRVAIVNNITVKQGDLVSGAKVLDITAEQVTLKYKDTVINARLNVVPVKRLIMNTTGH